MTTLRKNTLTFAALALLLGLTVGCAFLPLGVFHVPAALIFALIKAALVVAIFMRLPRHEPLRALALAAGVFWLLIMLTLTLSDYLTR